MGDGRGRRARPPRLRLHRPGAHWAPLPRGDARGARAKLAGARRAGRLLRPRARGRGLLPAHPQGDISGDAPPRGPGRERAAAEFVEYTRALLDARHDDPGDDLISELITAEEEGDRLSADEVVHLTSAILVGGVDTTQAQLAHALALFSRHPEQWRILAEDPPLAASAV